MSEIDRIELYHKHCYSCDKFNDFGTLRQFIITERLPLDTLIIKRIETDPEWQEEEIATEHAKEAGGKMRELKFRAWDKVTKRYYAVSGLEFDENGELCEIYLAGIQINESKSNANVRNPSEVILEQYTGIKDKNGQKIFEGDIVLVANKGRTSYVVKYREGDCSFVANNEALMDYFHLFSDMPKCYEVIGNIHENPELLGEEE